MPYKIVPENPRVFFDITCGERALDRVTVELFADVVPTAAENFRSLCTGERGSLCWLPVEGAMRPLFYKGVPFHRIIHGFCVQGGDIVHRDGRGSESIFGYPFPAENGFAGKAGRNAAGTVALVTCRGPNQFGSQFFFNMRDSPHLDGKQLVVGQVVHGWHTLQFMSQFGSRCGVPTTSCWISECGQSGGLGAAEVNALPSTPAPFLMPGKEVLDILRPRE